MRVGTHTIAQSFGARIACPHQRISEEETLFGSETIVHSRRILRLCFLERLISYFDAAMVCNVFTTSEGAIHMHARQNFYSIKGANHALCALLKVLFVLFSPPVAQITFLVKLCALVVKTVRHFVTNHHTDSSIIDSIIAISSEERRLENASRETNLVGCGIIISVDSLRCHSPFIAIHGFIHLALHFVVVGKGSSALQIFIE